MPQRDCHPSTPSDEVNEELAYLDGHCIPFYLTDALSRLAEKRPENSLRFVRDHVLTGTNVVGRDLAYILATPRNRLAFADRLADALDPVADREFGADDLLGVIDLLADGLPRDFVRLCVQLARLSASTSARSNDDGNDGLPSPTQPPPSQPEPADPAEPGPRAVVAARRFLPVFRRALFFFEFLKASSTCFDAASAATASAGRRDHGRSPAAAASAGKGAQVPMTEEARAQVEARFAEGLAAALADKS
ncbi:hypothetical protein HK405_013281 [Cladochytrium tenue]|nr:hypothetical protein HK405_013281 [Cladochytrium tenue]